MHALLNRSGVLKDVKVVPSKQQHLVLVEFYDKRDAGRAMLELNGKEIDGRRLLLQFGATETQTIRRYLLDLHILILLIC